jgi:hypothetical protein
VWLVLACVPVASAAQEPSAGSPARALEPIGALIDAFQSHQLVALGDDGHGNEQVHALRVALVRDPRFAATVNDIVVEFGNAKYQDLMDRFLDGASVPDKFLRQVWQNTTMPNPVWDHWVYEEFFVPCGP